MSFNEKDLRLANDSVLSLVAKALKYNDKLDEAFLVRGYCSPNPKAALNEFRKAIEINPNNSFAYYSLAGLQYSEGNVIEGFRDILRAIELEKGPMLVSLLKQLGLLYEVSGFNENAIDIYNQKFELTKDTLAYYRDMAGPSFTERNWKKSIGFGKRILVKKPSDYWTCEHLSEIYLMSGNKDSSVYYIKKILAVKPSYWGGFYQGAVLWLNGDKKGAEILLNKVADFLISLNRSEADISLNDLNLNKLILARIYAMKGDQRRAVDYLTQINSSYRNQGWFIFLLEDDLTFQNLRSNHEFREFLETTKSDWQKQHDKILAWLVENDLLKK